MTTPVTDTGATEPEDELPDAHEEQPDPAEGGDGEQPKRGVRQRLAEAEAERDELRQGIAAANAAIFNLAAKQVGVPPETFAGLGVRAEDYASGATDVADYERLVEAMEATRVANQIARKPQANPVAGRTTSAGGDNPPLTFAEVLKAHARGGSVS
ncbi:hypothetical protein AU192_24715 [Mycobacterium lehmannii]|uniref:Scaffolding protein n=1 Tax=Mycobacterium lehmannii TaxID=2048550 RepID=A0A101A4J2_9MYCO|nr:hypothetical protein [Mycobacterium lehmannii]KUI13387.1 hypothetical protein AU192_24715 [Mycobacterium lehmannii]